MSRQSTLWRLSRAALIAAALIALSTSAGTTAGVGPSLLLFPLRSHWLSEPLAEAVTSALSNHLSQAGHEVTEIHADSPVLRLAVSEGWVSADTLEGEAIEAARDELAVAVEAGATVTGEVVERETEIALHLLLAGTVSGDQVSLDVSVPRSGDRDADVNALASGVVGSLTADVWSEIGADIDGARWAAEARYAAGQTAMARGAYRQAVLDFDAALIGAPGDPDYLRGAAEARAALGDYAGAMARMRSLAALRPSDAEVALRLGYAALRAGQPTEAETAFLAAAEELGNDPRVVEGLALAARALGQPGRAEEYYQLLVALVPGLSEAPPWLPGLLANAEESVELAQVRPEDLPRQLGRLYLAGGYATEGVAALLSYHLQGDRPAYDDREYMSIASGMDGEAEAVARGSQGVFAAQAIGQFDDEQADQQMAALHGRSEDVASLAEQMKVSPVLEPAHRYRALAYNFLNQSNFESLMYLRTRDAERQRRAELLRAAFRKSLAQASSLAEGLLGPEP